MQKSVANSIQSKKERNDRIFTPPEMVDLVLAMCNFKDGQTVLDPCRGDGAFYDRLPDNVNKRWCEIDEGKDFFEWKERVDWVVGNPPYSIWNKWLEHTMNITDKFVYVFGVMNLTSSRIERILQRGYAITDIVFAKVEWWFSPSWLVKFERGGTPIVKSHPTIMCPDCKKSKCGRGRHGKDFNKCPTTQK